MSHRPRHLAVRLAVAAVLLWAAWGFGRELTHNARLHAQAPTRPARLGASWRFKLHPAVRLQRFLERSRPVLPPGSRVIFSSPQDRGNSDFFRYLWASYLRPDLVWIPAAAPQAGTAQYWLAFGKKESHPRLTPIHEEETGTVYRVEPEKAGGTGR